MPRVLVCRECDEIFRSPWSLDEHLVSKHGYSNAHAFTEVSNMIAPTTIIAPTTTSSNKKIDENQKLVG